MVIGIRRNEFRFRYDLLGITINYGTLNFTVPTLGDTPRGPYSHFAGKWDNWALERRSLSMTSGRALPATAAQLRTHVTSLIVI